MRAVQPLFEKVAHHSLRMHRAAHRIDIHSQADQVI
jgi:hypothetical protein